MNALELFQLASKIMVEAPVLLPDLLKLMNDQQQVFTDFQKLVADFQGIKKSVTAPAVDAAAGTGAAAS